METNNTMTAKEFLGEELYNKLLEVLRQAKQSDKEVRGVLAESLREASTLSDNENYVKLLNILADSIEAL